MKVSRFHVNSYLVHLSKCVEQISYGRFHAKHILEMELFEMIKLLYVWTWYDSDRPL